MTGGTQRRPTAVGNGMASPDRAAPASRWPLPSVTVDIVAFAVLEADLKVLLVRRKVSPFLGAWALPGGFVRVGPTAEEQGEDLDEAAERELLEETHLPPGSVRLRQLATFGPAGRDPRTRVITVAHWCGVRPELAAFARAGTDAEETWWCPTRRLGDVELAFDHRTILERGLAALQEAVLEEEADRELTPEVFSVAELRAVHEVVLGRPLDAGNFRRHFLSRLAAGEAVEAEGSRVTGRRRASVYRWRPPGAP